MGRLLLVGNSRWHWAERRGDGLKVWHEPGPPAVDRAAHDPWADLEAWTCVGQLPEELSLPAARRLALNQVPLQQLPPWLGIDRALAGWQAWRRQGSGVLVADAGTCLSLTWIDGEGRFRGGRLSAGLALQLRSLSEATAQLPRIEAAAMASAKGSDPWPTATAAAMEQGCLKACAAAVLQGWTDLQSTAEASQLWLTGGDSEGVLPLLRASGLQPVLAPDLVLEGLAAVAGLS
ncbi:MAG: type III pantothenate kinase [Vulcanococcus sp.]